MKTSFSLRAFSAYFVVLAMLIWTILSFAMGDIREALRKSAESVMVDTANLIATTLEHQFVDETLATWEIERLFTEANSRILNANIYGVEKNHIDTEVYITDRNGLVIYDSSDERTGEDYSKWQDIKKTLKGEYGARTSFRYATPIEGRNPSIMVVAAPIQFRGETVGVVSVVKPLTILDTFLSRQSERLQTKVAVLFLFAILLAYLVSQSFTRATEKLANYADEMARGRKVESPAFSDKRFDKLARSISRLRRDLDGKKYVEDYVHSLTHELKTPITSVRAAAELLQEDMPKAQQQKFVENIQNSSQRMSLLVERMLQLARLEGRAPIQVFDEFDLSGCLNPLLAERATLIESRKISIQYFVNRKVLAQGDQLLIQQAIANLLDNAIKYGRTGSVVLIQCGVFDGWYFVEILNQGQTVDDSVIERSFERFFSVPSHDTVKSTGLGLSFVIEIMRLHQGKASILNTPDGVQARIYWPE